jgi:hypothetical protein
VVFCVSPDADLTDAEDVLGFLANSTSKAEARSILTDISIKLQVGLSGTTAKHESGVF